MLTDLDSGILKSFVSESIELIHKCKDAMMEFSATGSPKLFENYGLYIDRIMGASYTLGIVAIGDLSKLGKEIGYKSSQVNDIDRLLALQGLLSQLNKEIEKMLKDLKKKKFELVQPVELMTKLEKANKSLGDLRSSVKF